MSADGNVPVAFRCTDGNTSDSVTHVQTWETLRAVAGRSDFLYVGRQQTVFAENMDPHRPRRGRFVTVMPRSRLEDAQFREWLQTHARVVPGVGSAQPALQRRAARLLVRPSGAATSMEAWSIGSGARC